MKHEYNSIRNYSRDHGTKIISKIDDITIEFLTYKYDPIIIDLFSSFNVNDKMSEEEKKEVLIDKIKKFREDKDKMDDIKLKEGTKDKELQMEAEYIYMQFKIDLKYFDDDMLYYLDILIEIFLLYKIYNVKTYKELEAFVRKIYQPKKNMKLITIPNILNTNKSI